MIRAVVHVGEFSNPDAEKYLGDVLIKRRNKIASAYLPAINPIVSPRLEGDRLTFENAAVAADVAKAPTAYHASWMLYDNATDETRPLSTTQSGTTTIEVPRGLPTAAGSMIAVDLSADSAEHESWKRPIRTYFRRTGSGWKLIGLERMPENLAQKNATRTASQ